MLPSLLDDHHPALALLPEVPTQEQIERFGEFVQSLEGEHGVVDISTMHLHADGLYGRSVVIKAGTSSSASPTKPAT
jgi:hypothetical protein